jgi:hypothetical protein
MSTEKPGFWDTLLKPLHHSEVRPLADRWRILKAEQYPRVHPGRARLQYTHP